MMQFKLPKPATSPIIIPLTIFGTATSGVDSIPLPDSLVIPVGQTSATFNIESLPNTLTEIAETIFIEYPITDYGSVDTLAFTLYDSAALTINALSVVDNGNGSATANAIGGSGSYNYQWDANAMNQTSQTATGLTSGTYTVTDALGCSSYTDSVSILINSIQDFYTADLFEVFPNTNNVMANLKYSSCIN